MQGFELWTPTRISFGDSHAENFAKSVAELGTKALVVIGGGSVKKLGYLQLVIDALHAQKVETHVYEGIESNPNADTVNDAAAVGKAFGATVVVPVGGGSTMDAAKAIAGLIFTGEPDIWPFVAGQPRAGTLSGSLPIAAVPTTAATASEVTPFAVISKYDANEKSVLNHEFFKPKAAWINPAFTVGVSATTTADGGADILSHVFENYLLGGNDSPLADGYSETVMRTVIDTLPETLKTPGSVPHRARLLWASTLALNSYQTAGRNPTEFVLHSMEHALSGSMSKLAHGRGLATLYPSYFRWLHAQNRGRDRLAKLGKNLFGLHTPDDSLSAMAFIERFEMWLKSVGLYQSLTSLGFSESQYRGIADYCVKVYGTDGVLSALGPITVDEIVAIFTGTARQTA